MEEKIAKNLVDLISKSSFDFWRQSDFRDLVKFESLTQTEQDRIFNELVVTGIILAMFTVDEMVSGRTNITLEKQISFSKIRKGIGEAYVQTLKDFGVQREFTRIWKKLIDLREKEYLKDLTLANQEAIKGADFKKYPELRSIWARIETLVIGSLHHIRRGKTSPKDPLWKMLRKWLIDLEKDLRRKQPIDTPGVG